MKILSILVILILVTTVHSQRTPSVSIGLGASNRPSKGMKIVTSNESDRMHFCLETKVGFLQPVDTSFIFMKSIHPTIGYQGQFGKEQQHIFSTGIGYNVWFFLTMEIKSDFLIGSYAGEFEIGGRIGFQTGLGHLLSYEFAYQHFREHQLLWIISTDIPAFRNVPPKK